MFYDIFCLLCERKGVSKTRATLDIGLSNAAATKWKKTGAIPDSSTLSKLATYFGVSTDFLLGLTSESYMLGTEHQLAEAKKQYETEADTAKRNDLALQIDILEESLEDQRIAAQLEKMSKKNTLSGVGERTDDIRAAFFGGIDAGLTQEEKDALWDEAKEYARFKADQLRKRKDRNADD